MTKVNVQTPTAQGARPARRTGWLDMLASVKFAVTVVVIIAAACVLGTVLPQGAEAAGYIERHPGAARWIDFLGVLGLTHVFTAWWFIGLLALLSATVATCSVRRILTVRRTTGFARRRAFGSMLTHISILLILAGGVVRGIWGESGYVELREGETKNEFLIENRVKPLPFALHLADFAIERYDETAPRTLPQLDHELLVQWPARKLSARVPVRLNVTHSLSPQGEPATAENTFHVRVLQYVPDFAMNSETREVISRSEEPNNPAVLVEINNPVYQNNCWLFAKHPDFKVHAPGHEPSGPSPLRIFYRVEALDAPVAAAGSKVKSFKSSVRLLEDGRPSREATVEVNRPVKHKSYTFYQTGYDPKDLTWTSLQVVRDPGVPLVYAGFAFLIAGLFTVFYLNPWLQERSKAV